MSDVRGGRVSTGDLDGDGYPDVVVHAVGNHNRPDLTKPPNEWTYRVMMNRPAPGGGRRFEDHTLGSGYPALRVPETDRGRSAQFAIFADLDDDGDLDVVSGTYADRDHPETDPGDRSEILLNDGHATFTLAPEGAISGDGSPLPTTSATLLDHDRDGILDVYVGNWYQSYGRSYQGVQDRLWRGLGDGTFEDVTAAVGLSTSGASPSLASAPRPTYGVTACDLDLDGDVEILSSSYGRQPNLLWRRDGSRYREVGVASGFAADGLTDYTDNELYRCYCQTTGRCTAPAPRIACDALYWAAGTDDQPWRLGGNTFTTACGDVDNDGDLDVYSAEIAHWHIGSSSDPSQLLLNDGVRSGVPVLRRPGNRTTGLQIPHVGTSWNEGAITAALADVDNDGLMDVVVGTSDYPDQYLYFFRQQQSGTFREAARTGGLTHACAPSFALADLDRDGDLDLVVTSSTTRDCRARWPNGPEVRVYENTTGQDANWTQIHLEGAGAAAGGANRSAIGAIVRVTAGGVTRTRVVQGGYGHFGMQHDLDVTVGLGEACAIDSIEVLWPDAQRTMDRFEDVRASYRIVIRQGEGLSYRQ
jgi:hypothetical protein